MPTLDNAHALVVGIAAYRRLRPLPATVRNDAATVARALADPAVGAYDPTRVRTLLDEEACASALRAALDNLARNTNDRSTVLIYFSGHGGRLPSGDFLLPVDAVYPDEAALAGSALSAAEFSAALRAIRARKLLVILDCCHAGGVGEAKDFRAGLSAPTLEQLQAGFGRVVLASSLAAEESWVRPGDAHSLFTKHLLAGLRGGVPAPDGLVRVFDLFHYLQPRVTAEQPNQHPLLKAEVGENFPIAFCSGGAPPPTVAAPAQDRFPHDVFISYRDEEPDRSWARKVLLPRIEAQGARACIDFRDFRLGRPRLKATEEAVESSRYTLSVLTPAYLTSQLAEMGSILARFLGEETNQSRWLGVFRTPCPPGLDMRSRMLLDMTDDADFDANLLRLTFELRQPCSS
jgi:Caspase domain/TIR domain